MRYLKNLLIFFLIICFVFNSSNVYAAPLIQEREYFPPGCQDIQVPELQREIDKTIEDVFVDQENIDFDEIVTKEWKILRVDEVFDKAVDDTVKNFKDNTGIFETFQSSWIPGKAEILAKEIVEEAFRSPTIKNTLSKLSDNVANEVASEIENISAKSSSYALECLQNYIGSKYSQSVVDIFSREIEKTAPNLTAFSDALEPETSKVLQSYGFAFGGIGVIITAQIAKRVSQRVVARILQQFGERILGRLGSASIPFVGEFVGVALLGIDIANSFEGAFPQIENALKKKESKDIIQQEITNIVEDEVRHELPDIARDISNDIFRRWRDFLEEYRQTITLVQESTEFKSIFDNNKDDPTQVSKMVSLVGKSLNNLGQNQLLEAVQDGTFERAFYLPENTYKVLRTHDIYVLVDWADLAGVQLEKVVSLELYKHLSPQKINSQLLEDLLFLGDDQSIAKLSLLGVDSIQELLRISKLNLVSLASRLSANDLEQLSHYIHNLNQPQLNQLTKFLLEDTSRVENSSLMNNIIQSSNIKAATEFWKNSKNLFSLPLGILSVLSGAISWRLLALKYGIFFVAILFSFPFLLLAGLGIVLYRKYSKKNSEEKLLGEANANQSGQSTESEN